MKDTIYRLVYCSRNLIEGSPEQVAKEIDQILATSRKNNEAVAVTGALLYNAGNFAQTLEGSIEDVERTFERVQQDMRHSEVTIVESGIAPERLFGNWSMALCGDVNSPPTPLAKTAFEAAFAHSADAGHQILGLLATLVTQDCDAIFV